MKEKEKERERRERKRNNARACSSLQLMNKDMHVGIPRRVMRITCTPFPAPSSPISNGKGVLGNKGVDRWKKREKKKRTR